jgi:hypothetical protein
MKLDREKWLVGAILLLFLLVITIPYIYAQSTSDESRVFGGFLLNPIDGNSYLAKMRQGFDGSWAFKLPYTADPGAGAALNLYYLFLGHAARWLGFSLIFTFHAFRILGSLLLGLALFHLFGRVFEKSSSRLLALSLALFGSGLGWLAAGLGLFTSDFWVAEAYPFLASFANPHFALGLALQIWLITPLKPAQSIVWKRAAIIFAAAALLSVVYPFGWAVTAAVNGAWLARLVWRGSPWVDDLKRWVYLIAGGAPYVIYSLWIVKSHPILAQWNAQNLTPAPSVADLVYSLSPLLLFALWAMLVMGRKTVNATSGWSAAAGKLGVWLFVGLLLIYLPFGLQRRLISGLFIPVVGLAILAWQGLKAGSLQRSLAIAMLVLSLPTNLLILSGGLSAARAQKEAIYIYADELAAFRWLDANAGGGLVMAAPETGLLIPAYSSARVLYGHPFETVEAAARKQDVSDFYVDDLDEVGANEILSREDVSYVFYGPRELEYGSLPALSGWSVVYDQGEVQIWAQNE